MYTQKQIQDGQTAYKKESLTTKQSTFVLILIVLIAMCTESCSRYAVSGPQGSCGAWYPKKCKVGTKGW